MTATGTALELTAGQRAAQAIRTTISKKGQTIPGVHVRLFADEGNIEFQSYTVEEALDLIGYIRSQMPLSTNGTLKEE